jgi:chemotaxis protein methyltransferase CheR
MKPDDYQFMVAFLKVRSGLVLSDDKAYLIENRLLPVVRKRAMNSLDDLFLALRTAGDKELEREVTEAMTTNESFFFRDLIPFQQFQETVLPKFVEARADTKRLRIWCAAAATGQEPYTLAMILKEEEKRLSGWQIEIVATDLSTEALERARAGRYSQFEVQRGLPVQYLMKYFVQEDAFWQIDQSLRSMIDYREFNLLDDISAMGSCDIIFCRNVLIYFDQEAKGCILDSMSKLLPDDGCLYLGGAETVLGVTQSFKPTPGLRGVYGVVGREEAMQGTGSAEADAAKQSVAVG